MATFKEATHQHYGWSTDQFAERLFLTCLDPGPRFLARLLWPWRDRLFKEDLTALGSIAELTSYNDVFQVAQNLSDSRHTLHLLRDHLGIRPRGRHLLAIARELLPGRRPHNAKVEPAFRPGSPSPRPKPTAHPEPPPPPTP